MKVNIYPKRNPIFHAIRVIERQFEERKKVNYVIK